MAPRGALSAAPVALPAPSIAVASPSCQGRSFDPAGASGGRLRRHPIAALRCVIADCGFRFESRLLRENATTGTQLGSLLLHSGA